MSYKLSVLLLAFVSFFSLVMLWLLLSPVNVIKPNVQPYKVLTKEVQVGKQLVYVVDACKYIDTTAKVTRIFVDAKEGTEYPPITESNNISTGCNVSGVSLPIPPFLLPDREYYMKLDINYKINALRDQPYHFRTETFMVKKASEGAILEK